MPKKSGFTLIELLIVISIIAVLTVIGLAAYNNFRKSSRNARRQSDLKFIQSALEEYNLDQKFYPGSLDFSVSSSLTNATGIAPAPAVTKTYLNNIPIGPNGSSEYLYKAYKWNSDHSGYLDCSDSDNTSGINNFCIKYCLYAQTEDAPIITAPSCPNQSGFNLAVTSP